MMDFFSNFIQPGLIYGLCYGIAAIGVSLPLRFLRTADFTAIGAIMLGAVGTVAFTNWTHLWILGVILGPTAAGLLGVLTAWLASRLKVPLMLAGIICFTASQSLGMLLSTGGQVDLTSAAFLSQKFTWKDAGTVAGITLSICVLGGLVAKSKYGCFAFAMCASERFVRFRHRNSQQTTAWLLFIANFLVGLAGGLLALKTRQAFVNAHAEFLSLTLGAIFAGEAAVRLLARILKRELPGEADLEQMQADPVAHRGLFENFRLSLSGQRDDSERTWFVLMSYVVASVLLNSVTQSVRGQSLPFHVPPEFEYGIVAAIIAGGLWISSLKVNASTKTR
jgi:putative ABC transport system permease protein